MSRTGITWRLDARRAVGLAVAAAVVAGLMLVPAAQAVVSVNTLYVDGASGDDATNDCLSAAQACKTINGAIGKASDGDTIQIAAGTYTEQVVIGKSLTVTGADETTTTIQAPGTLAAGPGTQTSIVLVNNGATVAMSHLKVAGPGPTGCGSLTYGIFAGGGATLNLDHARIEDIRDQPMSGCQNGVGVRIGSGALGEIGHGSVTNSTFVTYQKGAVVVDGAGTDATVSDNTITGVGATPLIAQNGIQISRGATATVEGNSISGNECDASSCGPDALDPATGTQSAGILIYQSGSGVSIQGNTVTTSDQGIYLNSQNAASSATVSGNTLTDNRYEGIVLDAGDATLTNNTISGTSNVGVLAAAYNGAPASSTGTLTGNTISGATTGVQMRDQNAADARVATVSGSGNAISGATKAADNQTTVVSDLHDNWWGSANGPSHAGNTFNTASQGGVVSNNITYVPWLDAASGGNSFAPVTTTAPAGSYASIQAGVAASNAGGTVNAAAGTFSEMVSINKGLTLDGAGKATTTVDGSTLGAGKSGINILSPVTGVTITDLSVTGFSNDGISIAQNNSQAVSSLLVQDVGASSNGRHGIWSQSFALTDVTFRRVTANNNNAAPLGSLSGRGLWLINGTKTNITVEDSTFNTNRLVGLDISDGTVTGASITGNTVTGNGDSGIAVLGPQGSGANLVGNNTVTDNGRYGIEIKVPDGNGAGSGPGSVVVSGNTVTRTVAATDPRDYGGIVVIRRSGLAGTNADQPNGVMVTGNTVHGYHRKPSGSTGDGFGIVVEGSNHVVTGNDVSDNDVGIQVQAGNTADTQGTPYFDRGSANTAAGTVVNGCNLIATSNADFGLRAVGLASPLAADHNWWGDVTGPLNATGNPTGLGATVSDTVTFAPWSIDAACSGSTSGAPAAPSGLVKKSGTTPAAGDVQLEFVDNATDEVGFALQRKEAGQPDSAYTQVATAAASSPASNTGGTIGVTDTTALDDKTYEYRVAASGSPLTSAPSNVREVAMPPAAPSAITATPSGGQMTVSWTDNSVVDTAYQIQRKDGVNGTYTTLTISANGGSYLDPTIEDGTVYAYRVRAYRDVPGSTTLFSAYIYPEAVTVVPLPAPASVTLGTVTASSAHISWAAVNGATGYRVARKVGANDTFHDLADESTLGAGATSYDDNGVTAGDTITYRVQAVRLVGGTTVVSGPAYSGNALPPLAAPTNVQVVSAAVDNVHLTWTGVAGADGYRVSRRVGATGSWEVVADEGTLGAGATSVTDTHAEVGTVIAYNVRAVRVVNGSTAASALAFADHTARIPMPAATGVHIVTAAVDNVKVAWTSVPDADGYRVERRVGSGGTWEQVADESTLNGGATSFTDTAADAGTVIAYRVRTVRTVNGTTILSLNAYASSQAAVPLPGVSGFHRTTLTLTSATLAWDDETDETGYVVERRDMTAGGDYAVIGSPAQDATTITDNGVIGGHRYQYRIRAQRTFNGSTASSPYVYLPASFVVPS